MKSALILLAKSTLFFGVLWLGYYAFLLGPAALDLASIIRRVLVPAAILSVALTALHIGLARQAGVTADFAAAKSTSLPAAVALADLPQKIIATTGWRLVGRAPEQLTFRSSFRSIKSFGEVITITRKGDAVEVNSRPLLFTTLFDFGQNHQNVRRVAELVG